MWFLRRNPLHCPNYLAHGQASRLAIGLVGTEQGMVYPVVPKERKYNMKGKDVQIGETYVCKVSGKLAPVQILRVSPHGGWDGRNRKTGRDVHIRGAGRIRRPVHVFHVVP